VLCSCLCVLLQGQSSYDDEDFFDVDEDPPEAPPMVDESLNRSIPSLPQIGQAPYKLGGVPVSGIVSKRKDSYQTSPTRLGEEVCKPSTTLFYCNTYD
jgi:hypothetical protein